MKRCQQKPTRTALAFFVYPIKGAEVAISQIFPRFEAQKYVFGTYFKTLFAANARSSIWTSFFSSSGYTLYIAMIKNSLIHKHQLKNTYTPCILL